MRYHVKEIMTPSGWTWVFDEQDIPLAPTGMLLVRIMVGKVENTARLSSIIHDIPIRQGLPDWNCVTWVQEGLQKLQIDKEAMGTSILEWDKVRDGAMEYCQRKKNEHRFDGQGSYDPRKAPTYDLVVGKETIA